MVGIRSSSVPAPIRVRLALRCAVVGQSCAELSGMCTCGVITPLIRLPSEPYGWNPPRGNISADLGTQTVVNLSQLGLCVRLGEHVVFRLFIETVGGMLKHKDCYTCTSLEPSKNKLVSRLHHGRKMATQR